MADMGDASWSEVDASNNTAAPTGWPDGQAPSTVKQTGRSMMGALKRFWDRSNSVLTTAGTTTAYTLTYAQAASVYYNGEEFAFIANATCGAAPTLNVNSLGARNIRKFAGGVWNNCVSGDIQANQAIRCYYNSGAMTFDMAAQSGAASGWTALDSQTPSNAPTYDLQSISSTINHLDVLFDLSAISNNVNLYLQFYNSGGVLDTSGVYNTGMWLLDGSGVSGPRNFNSASAILLANAARNDANVGISGSFRVYNLQGSGYISVTFESQWLDQAGAVVEMASGKGLRAVSGNITGIRLSLSSGNMNSVGKGITVMGTSN